MNSYMYCYTWNEIWRDVQNATELDAGLQKPAKTLGRKLCGHDSTTPPLDFRSCSDAQFDKEKDTLSQLGDQHGSRSNGGQRLRPSRRAG